MFGYTIYALKELLNDVNRQIKDLEDKPYFDAKNYGLLAFNGIKDELKKAISILENYKEE